MKIGRNAPCPCGSGKKYKVCCERKKAEGDWSKNALYIIAAVLVLGVIGFVYGMTNTPEDGRVWSAEHGHWHNADGTELNAAAAAGAGAARFVPQPAGEAPEGLVWSSEHGHWHDAITGMEPTN